MVVVVAVVMVPEAAQVVCALALESGFGGRVQVAVDQPVLKLTVKKIYTFEGNMFSMPVFKYSDLLLVVGGHVVELFLLDKVNNFPHYLFT